MSQNGQNGSADGTNGASESKGYTFDDRFYGKEAIGIVQVDKTGKFVIKIKAQT